MRLINSTRHSTAAISWFNDNRSIDVTPENPSIERATLRILLDQHQVSVSFLIIKAAGSASERTVRHSSIR